MTSGPQRRAAAELERQNGGDKVFGKVVWAVAGVIVFWSFGFAQVRASDLWWHLAEGRWIWQHHHLSTADPFSFTAHSKWVIDSWLSDVLLYAWTLSFGLSSLVYWKWIVLVATFFLLAETSRKISGDRTCGFLGAVLAAAVAEPFLDIRPQLFSLLCLVILLHLLVGPREQRWRRVLIMPLIALWVNLHAGFSLGLLVLAAFLLCQAIVEREILVSAGIFAGAVLASLINPFGFLIYRQPLLYALHRDSPFQTIGEWLPPFDPGGMRSILYPVELALFVGATILVLRGRERRRFIPFIAIGAVTMAMSLTSRRFIPGFAICGALTICVALAPSCRHLWRRVPSLVVPIFASVVAVFLLLRQSLLPDAFSDLTAEQTFPTETMDFVEKNEIRGRVFAFYNWGGFIQWRTDGRMKVFIDGRASAVFDETTYEQYRQVLLMRSGWESVIEGSGADYILWPVERGLMINTLMQTNRWRVLHQDDVAFLLVRAELAPPP